MQFTGEQVVAGKTPARIWQDHIARYELACQYVYGKKVLDIACGTGYGSKFLLNSGAAKVVGVDISDETIEFADREYKTDELIFETGDIEAISYPDNYFGVITCFETIEHVDCPEKALCQLKRVLKPNGLLIISTPNRNVTAPGQTINDSPANRFHVREYSADEFISELKTYFEIKELYGQRGKNKKLFIPLFKMIIERILPAQYAAEAGNPKPEKLSFAKEYRYIVVVCSKTDKI